MSQIQVTDRPVTQQGLGGPKTALHRAGNQRLVQDKTYYIGLLRDKMNALTAEVARLRSRTEAIANDQADYVSYEKRAESLAKQLEDLRAEQGDYNTLVDKMNTSARMTDMQMEHNELKIQNDREANQLDALFEQKQQRESMVKGLERELKQEEKLAESVISNMDGGMRKKYMDLKEVNERYVKQIMEEQEELDALNVKKNHLDEEISSSAVRQEAVRLTEQLRRLQARRQQLQEELESQLDPQEEREMLLKQIKEDNAETVAMEKGIKEMEERIEKIEEDIEHLDVSIDMNNGGEKNQQYLALKQKEKVYEEFFENFEENKSAEENCMISLQESVVALLETISKLSTRTASSSSNNPNNSNNTLPTKGEFKQMVGDLASKQEEKERSEVTMGELNRENAELQENLKNLQNLETKMKNELIETKNKMAKMEGEMDEFQDLDKLKRDSENNRIKLERESEELESRRKETGEEMRSLQERLSHIKSQLDADEGHKEIVNLERKWLHLEQNNHAMKEFIASKFQGCDFRENSKKVVEMVKQYNQLLIQKLNSRK